MLLGLTAALLAAVLFGVVAVVQAAVVRRQGLFSPMILLVVGIYLAGWVLHFVAIRELPLYLAQVGVGSSLVVTALVAARVMSEPLEPLQWTAVGAMAAGLGLLAMAAGPVGDSHFSTTTTVVLYTWLVLNAMLGWLAWRVPTELGSLALGVLAGAAYGGSPVATRALVGFRWDLQSIAPALTIGLFGTLGFVLYSAAMKRGAITAATAPVVLQSTVVPAVVGLVTFGDEVRSGWWPAAIVAFAVSVAAGVVLCGAEARLERMDDGSIAAP
ncbi:MAG TPA: hypothetical protein VHO29_02820 [Marmoricola sp.]|nr:hypothetical protein [Marmoricola sp.]